MDISEIVGTTLIGDAWRAILVEWARLYGADDPEAVASQVWAEFHAMRPDSATMARMTLRTRC